MTVASDSVERRGRAAEAPTLSGRVLVVDDDELAADALAAALRHAGCTVDRARDASTATQRLAAFMPDVLVTEARLPGHDGYALLDAAHRHDPLLGVLFTTRNASVPDAVRAMRAGAEHYLCKPVATAELLAAVRTVLERKRLRRQPTTPDAALVEAARLPGLVGASEPMRALLARVALVAPSRTTVLLLGETGTGKERVAEAIHAASPRANGPFVRVHCAALAEGVLESELFGHERGAFTGAHARREGRFEMAHGGTIFLDEIGELSPSVQVKLLRVLQERRFERVGGGETVAVDVRILAATHRDLPAMVEAGQFRADLFYRLNVVTLEVPPLRARRSDVPLLVHHTLAKLARELGVPRPAVAPEAMRVLERHEWPGNVRELENVLERAVVLSQNAQVTAADLSPHLLPALSRHQQPVVPGASFAEIERHAILTTYEASGRNVIRTAQILGLSARTVHYRLREYRGERGRRSARGKASSGAQEPGSVELHARATAH